MTTFPTRDAAAWVSVRKPRLCHSTSFVPQSMAGVFELHWPVVMERGGPESRRPEVMSDGPELPSPAAVSVTTCTASPAG